MIKTNSQESYGNEESFNMIRIYLLLSLFLIPTTALANQCRDLDKGDFEKKSGSLNNSNFDFTFVSYLGDTDEGEENIFGRCIFNKHENPVWVEWRKLRLTGAVAKSGDTYKVEFDGKSSDKKTDSSELYYGPRPDELNPDAIYHPDEASAGIPDFPSLVKHAQFSSDERLGLEDALQSSQDFEAYTVRLRQDLGNVEALPSSRAYARLALPISDEAFRKLREGDEDVNDAEFFSVYVNVVQTYLASDGVLQVLPRLQLGVSRDDLEIFRVSSIPLEASFEGSDDGLLEFLGVSPQVKADGPVFRTVNDKGLEYAFPVRRRVALLRINFNEYGRVEIPVLLPVRP